MKAQLAAVPRAVPADVFATLKRQPAYPLHYSVNKSSGVSTFLLAANNQRSFATCQPLGPDIIVWYMKLLSKYYPALSPNLHAAINAVTPLQPTSLAACFSMDATAATNPARAARSTFFPHLPEINTVLILPTNTNHYYTAMLVEDNKVMVVDGYRLCRLQDGRPLLTMEQKRQLAAHFATRKPAL
jgi:hypothetical protein